MVRNMFYIRLIHYQIVALVNEGGVVQKPALNLNLVEIYLTVARLEQKEECMFAPD